MDRGRAVAGSETVTGTLRSEAVKGDVVRVFRIRRKEQKPDPALGHFGTTLLPKVPSTFAAPDTSWGRAAECVKSRPGETGSLLCSHPLSAGRDVPSRGLDWTQSARQVTCLGGRADRRRPSASNRRRSRKRPGGADSSTIPRSVGCNVLVYMLAGLEAQPTVTRELVMRRIAEA